jgi:hypothetical protein
LSVATVTQPGVLLLLRGSSLLDGKRERERHREKTRLYSIVLLIL